MDKRQERATAEHALAQCQRHCKTAILMILAGVDAQQATQLLAQNKGFIRQALAK
ncbi:hypothetical protein [Acinetobacter baumannii]|uniref:hypothetical protein n=1 Tax=Acinetobacter baumannii TaxID=470 RepID=UPI00406CFC77